MLDTEQPYRTAPDAWIGYKPGTPRTDFVEIFEAAYQELMNANLLSEAYGTLVQKAIRHAHQTAKQQDELQAAFQPVIGGIYNDKEYALHLPSAAGSTVLRARYYTNEQLLKELQDGFRDEAHRLPPGWRDPIGFRWARSNTRYKATWVDPIWEKQ